MLVEDNNAPQELEPAHSHNRNQEGALQLKLKQPKLKARIILFGT
jgi:hypothetical protein